MSPNYKSNTQYKPINNINFYNKAIYLKLLAIFV